MGERMGGRDSSPGREEARLGSHLHEVWRGQGRREMAAPPHWQHPYPPIQAGARWLPWPLRVDTLVTPPACS